MAAVCGLAPIEAKRFSLGTAGSLHLRKIPGMSIQIAAYKGVSGISRVIQLLTYSTYSHTAIRFSKAITVIANRTVKFKTDREIFLIMDGSRQRYFKNEMVIIYRGSSVTLEAGAVIEAWAGGVRLAASISTNHTPGTKVDLFEFKTPLGPGQERRAAEFLISHIGMKYAYINVLRFIPIVRIFIPDPAPLSYDRTHVFCSELACEGMAAAGTALLERCEPWEIPPRDPPRSPMLKLKETMTTI